MTHHHATSTKGEAGCLAPRLLAVVLATLGLALLLGVGTASASKQPVDFFGGEGSGAGRFADIPEGIAVNESGAGPAAQGDIYVTDTTNNRIERFARNDNGTPANGDDDTYSFVSAWGADVDSSTAGAGYEVCAVAAACQEGNPSGVNGALSEPEGLAVDQDTGDVYVVDSANARVDIYGGDGAFLRSFGFDVVASGPDDTGTGYEVCIAANGDICKAGVSGSGVGQIGIIPPGGFRAMGIAVSQPDGSSATGSIFLADRRNTRINTYHLDGSAPAEVGSASVFGAESPNSIAVDSRGIVYASTQKNGNEVARYDSEDANGGGVGFLAPIFPGVASAEATALTVDPDSDGAGPDSDVLYVARTDSVVQQFGPVNAPGLSAAPTAFDDVHGNAGAYAEPRSLAIDRASGRLYVGTYRGEAGNGVYVLGTPGPGPSASLDSLGEVTASSFTARATITPNGPPALSYNLEYSTNGTTWESTPKAVLGSQKTPQAVTIALPAGTLQPDTFYHVRLVAKRPFFPAIVSPEKTLTTLSSPPLVETTGSPVRTTTTARLDARVDPAGAAATYHFEYGTEGPCDSNPCTSTPIRNVGPNEIQEITIKASAGKFKLSFGPDTTPELPFNASAAEVQTALQALPSIGAGNVKVSGGPGDLSGSHPYLVTFTGERGASDVNEITVLSGEGKNALSSPHSATVETTQAGGGGFNEAQSVTVAASGGQFRLGSGASFSTDLAFNASAAEVQAALEALPPIGAGNVVVSGGPGDATGSKPYVVRFVGTLANKDVAQLVGSDGATPLSGITEFGAQTTVPGGVTNEYLLVSQQIEGLQPNTTYHYRVIADNGNPAGPQSGEDMTVTTFAPEAPLSHGHLPGPVGSDRAWELVSAPDTGGNPVGASLAPGAASISDNGDRAVYGVAGGTPLSETGTTSTRLFAERTASGWVTKKIFASREEATSVEWSDPAGPGDLSTMFAENNAATYPGEFSIWKMKPDAAPVRLFGDDDSEIRGLGVGQGMLLGSEDGSRAVISLKGSWDPEHPAAPASNNLYDISSGQPRLLSLLPGDTVSSCGITQVSAAGGVGMPSNGDRSAGWLSADGSHLFFESNDCSGPLRVYTRDIPAEETKKVSASPLSGPGCDSYLIRSLPGAAYFYTHSRLTAEDSEPPAGCDGNLGGDVYRYDLNDDSLKCVTCVAGVAEAAVTYASFPDTINLSIAVAEDGSRIYFTSGKRLLPGAPASQGVYRLDTGGGDLAYTGVRGFVGTFGSSEMSADGSVVVFASNSPNLNALGGQQNGGTEQYYRYDDRDRSLLCVSCPADGSPPRGLVSTRVKRFGPGANSSTLSADGEDFAFATPTPLAPADQNTSPAGQNPNAGTDVYEWREGKILLVSDGLTNWPGSEYPGVSGITPSGHDIFFTAAAQYTPDALDGYKRLYDARIGGGFEFPPPPPPCPLEVCQGTPKGAPEEQAPGTATIAGAGDAAGKPRSACAKPKRKVKRAGKTRCVARHPKKTKKPAHQQAKHNRRTAR